MSWSSGGTVASFPSVRPTLGSTFLAPTGGLGPLTARLDPGSRIVYLTGTVVPNYGGTSSGLYVVAAAAPLPASFRPITQQQVLLFAAQSSAYSTALAQINTDGTVYVPSFLSGGANYAVNAHYFTDV